MIKSVLLIRCYDSLKANFYINELNKRGIYAFLANEHTTDLIPFGDGGYQIHVDIDKLDEAATIIEEIDKKANSEEDFSDADHDDIAYEALKTKRIKNSALRSQLLTIFVIVFIIALLIIYVMRGRIL